MEKANLIGRDHASFGANQAWFLFAMAPAGNVTKLFLVDAKNPWAVHCLESILEANQSVSPTCKCVMVFRDCDIGMRSDLGEEISFVDFFRHIVNPDLWLGQTKIMHAFQQAIRTDIGVRGPDLASLVQHMDNFQSESSTQTKASPLPKESAEYAKVFGIVQGLGYKKPQVESAMEGLHSHEDTNRLVQKVLQNLAG